MALGHLIVRDLKLERSDDTLGRWMAHHIAELILRAEGTKGAVGRTKAEREAAQAILALWSHRAGIDRINPLAGLRPVLSVLRTLSQEKPPWAIVMGDDGPGHAARTVYDLLRRLTICLCLLQFEGPGVLRGALTKAARTRKHQSKPEREVLARLAPWLEIAKTRQKRRPRSLAAAVLDMLEEASDTLAELRQSLTDEQTNAPKGAKP